MTFSMGEGGDKASKIPPWTFPKVVKEMEMQKLFLQQIHAIREGNWP